MVPAGAEYLYVEKPSMELLEQLGWKPVDAFSEVLGPEGTLGRDSQHDVILTHRLRLAMRKLNPEHVPEASITEAIEVLTKDRSVMDRVRANREVHDLLSDGYQAEWTDDNGVKQIETLKFLDLRDPASNDLLAVQQMWVKGDLHSRRLDVALFVNGVPLVLMEFKEPNESVKSAYDNNLTDYRDAVPQLFIPNCFVLLSNGSVAKIGSTYSPWEFFNDWKVIDAHGTRGAIALETALRGTCDPAVLLDLLENFVAYMERPGGLIKVIARSHQYLGVNAAIDNLHRARAEQDKRLGVFWHTQGSGKSLSMLWFTQKVLRRVPGRWTFVMVTDRTELDTQLHKEFASAGAVSAEARVHASCWPPITGTCSR
jgi:type I restriction enzyme R subunit